MVSTMVMTIAMTMSSLKIHLIVRSTHDYEGENTYAIEDAQNTNTKAKVNTNTKFHLNTSSDTLFFLSHTLDWQSILQLINERLPPGKGGESLADRCIEENIPQQDPDGVLNTEYLYPI